jgi:predicted RNA methylase
MSGQNYWGGSDLVFQCLVDEERVLGFKKIIEKCVKKGDIVVDLGTGTGILALLAAEAGAGLIYAIESDENLHAITEQNLLISKHSSRIKLIKADAAKIELPEKVDVVICEMVATGLIDELQVPVMNNIGKYCKDTTKMIPKKIVSFVEAVEAHEIFCGHKMHVIQYEYAWSRHPVPRALSEKVQYLEVDFRNPSTNEVSFLKELSIKEVGNLNAIKITSVTIFPDDSILGSTSSYCMPLILPLPEMKVEKGDKVLIRINYKLCEGMKKLDYSAVVRKKDSLLGSPMTKKMYAS